jgi:HSP20 family protein
MKNPFTETPIDETDTAPVHTLKPRVNIRESEDAVYIDAEMPGVAPDNVDIELVEGRLRILGRTAPVSFDGLTLARGEYSLRAYERSFRVSDKFEPKSIKASMKDGLLRVELHKRKAVKPKRIKVRAA